MLSRWSGSGEYVGRLQPRDVDPEVGLSGGATDAYVETTRLRPDRDGLLRWRPKHIPLVSVQSLSCGPTLSQLTTYSSPDFTLEDERTVVVDLTSSTARWTGALQSGIAVDGLLYVILCYLAG